MGLDLVYLLKNRFFLLITESQGKEMPERRINMIQPIIACDVSKNSSHVQGFIGLENPIGNPFVVQHIRSDLVKVKSLAKELEKETKIKPVFVFEFTGFYHESIVQYIREIGLDLFAISPLESAKVRKSKIRVTKTDSKDCLNIATVYYSRSIRPYVSDNNDIKAISRRLRSLKSDLTAVKCRYRRYIDYIWPYFDEYFPGVDRKIPREIIANYKHPYVLKKRTSRQIAEVLTNNCRVSHKRALDIADKTKQYALEVVSGVPVNSEYVRALFDTVEEMDHLEIRIEELTNKLMLLLRNSNAYRLLKTIPGFGENISLIVASELGDYKRFKTSKQLIAYCGLDPSILQSGKDDGEHYSITRKGNPILRSQIYLGVSQMLGRNDSNQIKDFYLKKKSSGLSHKVAAVASCRKLLCIIFGMLKNGTCFETI